MATFLIRKATPSDARALLLLSKSVLNEGIFTLTAPDESYYTEAQEKGWIEESVTNQNHVLLVAENDNGELIGSVDFSNGHRKRIFHTGEISIQVIEGERNHGVGSALLAAFLDWANQNPTIERVSLRVRADNERAIHLYEKFGFEKEGHLHGELKYGQGQYTDILIYSKWIKNALFCKSS